MVLEKNVMLRLIFLFCPLRGKKFINYKVNTFGVNNLEFKNMFVLKIVKPLGNYYNVQISNVKFVLCC